MRIAILTADETIYVPAFFDRFLAQRASDVAGIFICNLVYNKQSKLTMVKKYMKTFGVVNTISMALQVTIAKIKDRLGIGFKSRKFTSVASAAKYYNVPAFFPANVNTSEFHDQLRSMDVDTILSVSCPQIFKDELISLPANGCLNLHGADLPEYRGIMPSFWMLANDEKQAGVTIFFVNAGIDTGDVAGKELFPILEDDTLDSFIIRAKQKACDLALDVLDQIEAGTVERTPLEGKGSYYGWPTREAYLRFRKLGRKMQ